MSLPEKAPNFRLCRFHDTLPPLSCVRQASFDIPKTCWELEDCLEECLDDQNMSSETPPLRYMTRPDVSWLACQRPYVSSKGSILGLIEEDHAQPRDLPIQMCAWTASAAKELTAGGSRHCRCHAPHRDWRRAPLLHLASPPPLADIETPVQPRGSDSVKTFILKTVDWVDFRSVGSIDLPTPASVTHFLRSIFGASLDASPWINDDDHTGATAASEGTACLSDSDCVLLIFSNAAPSELINFRVSDACPSWSLYSVASVQLPVLVGAPPAGSCSEDFLVFPWQADKNAQNILFPAQILAYRRLPRRDRLSSIHPQSMEPASKGCLWETRTIYPPSESTDCPTTPYYNIRLVAPPYINAAIEYPSLQALTEPHCLEIMKNEVARIPQWTAWPEQQHYQVKRINDDDCDTAPWHVFPLCHCFPADHIQNRKWIPLTAAHVPQTVALLMEHLGDVLRTALFSRLDPGAVLEAHTGWQDLANHVYRVHVPLLVPPGGLCGTWVDGCVETHEIGLENPSRL
jgi:hypothetical protein